MSEGHSDLTDEALGRRLRADLPRHVAPARLRAAVAEAPPRPSRGWWLAPALSAAATALVLLLFFVPLLPRVGPTDPVQRLARAVVSEHTRVALWGARQSEVVPAGTVWLSQETGINLSKIFSGDERLTLVATEPVYLDQRRGVALHYRDADGHHLTYIVLPAPGLGLPERRRVKVDRWRPALLQDDGFSVWVWKQGDLACFIVSDMASETDLAQFKDYFVRLRTATEPKPAY
ncbi:MAG TPA: hypothetical protein VLF19_00270 [Methylomirabilota bacterium]|nr:hypothetical protein [Methylomirabilota bacterium]